MISKEEVQHIVKLARLGLTDEEITKMQKELSAILDYIEKLKEVDIEGVEPTSHSLKIENVMREDKIQNANREAVNKMIGQVPETKDGFVKVKSVF